MTQSLAPLVQALELQGVACARFGSAFSGEIAKAVAADIAADGVFAGIAEPFAGQDARALLTDAVPLRFLGGLHFLVLKGRAAELAAVYPPHDGPPDPAVLSALVGAAAADHAAFFRDFLTSPLQTNEVNRSVCLSAGLLTVAQRTGLPLRCLEIGASAGLNMNWDRYRYDLGEQGAWGDPASPVTLTAEWSGASPAGLRADVIERLGCDLSPIDLGEPDAALRLQAYVWPDQPERMARLAGAIAIARAQPPQIERADAADWVRRNIAPTPGAATALYHSVMWPYLPSQTQADITASVTAAGESASASRPLIWLRLEPNPADLAAPLNFWATFWPGGEEILLAHAHPHGVKVSWTGE